MVLLNDQEMTDKVAETMVPTIVAAASEPTPSKKIFPRNGENRSSIHSSYDIIPTVNLKPTLSDTINEKVEEKNKGIVTHRTKFYRLSIEDEENKEIVKEESKGKQWGWSSPAAQPYHPLGIPILSLKRMKEDKNNTLNNNMKNPQLIVEGEEQKKKIQQLEHVNKEIKANSTGSSRAQLSPRKFYHLQGTKPLNRNTIQKLHQYIHESSQRVKMVKHGVHFLDSFQVASHEDHLSIQTMRYELPHFDHHHEHELINKKILEDEQEKKMKNQKEFYLSYTSRIPTRPDEEQKMISMDSFRKQHVMELNLETLSSSEDLMKTKTKLKHTTKVEKNHSKEISLGQSFDLILLEDSNSRQKKQSTYEKKNSQASIVFVPISSTSNYENMENKKEEKYVDQPIFHPVEKLQQQIQHTQLLKEKTCQVLEKSMDYLERDRLACFRRKFQAFQSKNDLNQSLYLMRWFSEKKRQEEIKQCINSSKEWYLEMLQIITKNGKTPSESENKIAQYIKQQLDQGNLFNQHMFIGIVHQIQQDDPNQLSEMETLLNHLGKVVGIELMELKDLIATKYNIMK